MQFFKLPIVMVAALGAGAGIAIVACLIIFDNNADASSAVTNVGKLFIDTDAGADDAVAILLALHNENINSEAEVVGISCVNGNTYVDNVVENVLKTLKVADRLDIPVFKGADRPLLTDTEKTEYFGKDGFGDFDYPDPPSTDLIQEDHAAIAMIKLVKANPGKVTLLALGPLTNVALAIRIHPSFLDDLQQLIILGGSTEGGGNIRPGVEFNFGVDPAANYVVFNASTSKPAILVSGETALRAKLTMEFRKSLRATKSKKIWLIDSAESVTLNEKDEFWECADAVAASVALTSGTIVTKSTSVYSDAIYEGSLTAGMIVVDRSNITKNIPNTNLIEDIDIEKYEKMILAVFS